MIHLINNHLLCLSIGVGMAVIIFVLVCVAIKQHRELKAFAEAIIEDAHFNGDPEPNRWWGNREDAETWSEVHPDTFE